MESKIFLDTNVVIDHITQRALYPSQKLFKAIEENQIKAVISVGSMYTITYYTEIFLKKKGFTRPVLTEYLRGILDSLIQIVEFAPTDKSAIANGISDLQFDDIEDSYQYQSALSSGCDFLLTRNIKDFQRYDNTKICVITPEEYIIKYID